jgi:hypothetical protein
MTENTGTTPLAGRGDDDFERRLFAALEEGDLHFPRGAWRAHAENPPPGVLGWLRAWVQPRRFPKLVLTAALAYGLALVVSAPVYMAFSSRTAPSEPAAATAAPAASALGSARTLDLGAGPTRAGGGAREITIGPHDAFVILSFLVPIEGNGRAVVTATLADGTGRVIAQQPVASTDDLGNFVLVCRSDLFATGDYRLTIVETASARAGAPETPHRFSFHVSRARP